MYRQNYIYKNTNMYMYTKMYTKSAFAKKALFDFTFHSDEWPLLETKVSRLHSSGDPYNLNTFPTS